MPKKLEKMYRQMMTYTLVLLMSVLLLAGLIFLALYSPSVQKDSTQAKNNVNYVLVNEDTGAKFNGQAYNLGNDFVTLINQDTQDNWQNTSLSVANAGLKSGVYDVEIVLPQNFSQCLLSLQSATPQQANISYKVKSGESEIANAAIEQKVGTILNSFNQRIVQMYFSTILGNLYAAQRNVDSIIYGQQTNVSALQSTVYTPFHDLPSSFSSIVSNAQALQSQTQSWQDQQNAFTTQTQSLLSSTADSLNQNLSSISDYTSLQNSLANINFQNAQLSVNAQSANDYTYYKGLYNTFSTTMTNQLQQIYQPSGDTLQPTGPMPDVTTFQKAIKLLQGEQDDKLSDLQAQIDTLKSQVKDLTNQAGTVYTLRKTIAQNYFANATFDPTTASQADLDTQAKAGIINLISSVSYQGNLPQPYLNALKSSLENLDDTDLHTILDMLHKNNVITDSEYTNYQNELSLVEKYAKDMGISLNKDVTLNYLTATNGSYPDSSSYTLSGNYTFDTGKTYQLVLNSTAASTGSVANLSYDTTDQNSVKASILASLTTALSKANLDFTPTVTVIGNTAFISFAPTLASTPSSSDTTTSSSTTASSPSSSSSTSASSSTPSSSSTAPAPAPAVPQEATFSAPLDTITVDWTFSGTEKNTSYNQADYTLALTNTTDNQTIATVSGQLSAYFDLTNSNDVLVSDLKNLLSQFQTLDQGANQIVSIFGTPSLSTPTDNITSFYNTLNTIYPNATFPNLPQSSFASSVYYSYGNLTDIEKENLITSSLLANYEKQGTDLWKQANDHYNDLESSISQGNGSITSLQDIHDNFPNLQTMRNEANALLSWAEDTQNKISEDYDNWSQDKASKPLPIAQKETDQVPDDDAQQTTNIIWFNTATGQQVVTNFTELINSSTADAASTANAQKSIASITSQFQALSQETTQIQNDTNSVLDNVNKVAEQANGQVSDNTSFADNFNAVMANARIGGSNNQAVFNFLSSPVNYAGTVGKIYKPNLIPYFMTLIGFLLATAVGNGIRLVEKRRKQAVSEQLVVPSRVWLNTPTVAKTGIAALVIGGVFGISSQMILSTKNALGWSSYVFLLMLIGIFLVTYLFRQLPKLSLYLLAGVLGLYLILTPFLGITVAPHSLVDWIFRFSPLQNVENGYQALIKGTSIGWLSYLILFLILAVSIALNFTVKTKAMKEANEANEVSEVSHE